MQFQFANYNGAKIRLCGNVVWLGWYPLKKNGLGYWDNVTSSINYIKPDPISSSGCFLFYDDVDYSGDLLLLNDGIDNPELPDFVNNKIESVLFDPTC